MALDAAIVVAVVFALTNGFHDAANAIATLVATRGARPGEAIVILATFTMLGAFVVGTAVANTIAGIVVVSSGAVAVIGAGALGAVVWNVVTWWLGLPSSSSHALVGGLVGSGLVASGVGAVNWGGFDGWRPVGVVGVLVVLALAPPIGLAGGFVTGRAARRLLRRASRRVRAPIRAAEWSMTALLAVSLGANDAQKSMGVIAALLLAGGRESNFAVPFWVKLACGGALTMGTTLGGWRIVRTVGRRIVKLAPVDGLASQTTSAGVVLAASYVGAPVSTTHVVASSVVGVGTGRRRWRHIRWTVVQSMGLAWLLTLPAAAALGAAGLVLWRWMT